MIRTRSDRVTLVVVGLLAVLFAGYFVWMAVSDYQMQERQHWKFRCADAQIMFGFLACISIAVAVACGMTYKADHRREVAVHGSRKV